MAGLLDYRGYDGLGLAALVRAGDVTPAELAEAAIARIEALNPGLNAVIEPLYEQARAAVRGSLPKGPFTGVPFLLKDLTAACAGAPLRSGSRFQRQYVPDRDSELVRRYRAAGLVILGKTNTPEYGITPYTEPELFGPTRNPWDPARSPGGSSGGSAAAVAAGMVPMAHGGDGGGSIRIPASCCGLFGLKPTRGRTPAGPDHAPPWHGCVVEHVLTRTVRDSAAMLDATAGPDAGAPYAAAPPARPFLDEVNTDPGVLRIAFTERPFMGQQVHDDCRSGLETAVGLLQELGHTVVEDAPPVGDEALAVDFLTMVCVEVQADIREAAALMNRRPTPGDFEPGTWALALLGEAIRAADLNMALRRMHQAARRVGQFFEGYDVLLTPTLARPPIVIGALQPSPLETAAIKALGRLRAGWLLAALDVARPIAARTFDYIPYTPLFNITGQPAMSVPLYWNAEGLPIGMQFAGRYGDEATLFRLAGQLERAQPWFDRVPRRAAQPAA